MTMFSIESLWEMLFSVLISVIVGAAKVFSKRSKKSVEVWWVIGQLFVSGAAGLLMVLFARGALNLSGDLLGLAAGVAGWGGSLVIDALYKKTMNDSGVTKDEKNKSS